ncbi:MAG: 3-isopropylmalate dehydrogenase [Simkaniaceae bacterium]|nr:3-isopropylmalate dehydrogenase [Simkaniaceae bacterium]
MKSITITVLRGDGIGSEVMTEALKLLDVIGKHENIEFQYQEAQVGGAAIDATGYPISDETLDLCKQSKAVLLGAIGGPKWDNLEHARKPETALLKLRSELGLFTNLRPAKVWDDLVDASSLKPEVVSGVDLVVVRELTGGIYFSEPRGLDENRGWNTLAYSRHEVERIARVAFELAQKRSGRLTSVDKANVLDSSQFWRNIVVEVHKEYPDVTLGHLYVDNAAMQLVRDPHQFDVIVTQNMFGDILSDLASTIVGSLGMLPSASLGPDYALYEPVHGTAPEIAGQNKANPIAMIQSVAMMLTLTLDLPKAGQRLDQAIDQVLYEGYRTADIAESGLKVVSTDEMGNRICDMYSSLAGK